MGFKINICLYSCNLIVECWCARACVCMDFVIFIIIFWDFFVLFCCCWSRVHFLIQITVVLVFYIFIRGRCHDFYGVLTIFFYCFFALLHIFSIYCFAVFTRNFVIVLKQFHRLAMCFFFNFRSAPV